MELVKPNVIFFSRDYQSEFFPYIKSDYFRSLHVTLTKKEKNTVLDRGGEVIACLEEDYDDLQEEDITYPYLRFSLASDRFLQDYTYADRIKMLKKLAFFWASALDKYRPIAAVNEPIAIEASEVLWIELNKRKIPYLALSSFYQDNTFYFQPEPLRSTSFKNIVNTLRDDIKFRELAYSYIDRIRSGQRPSYVLNLSSRTSLSKLFEITKKILFEKRKRRLIPRQIIRQLCYGDSHDHFMLLLMVYFKNVFKSQKAYNNLDDVANVDYLFFPLHYEPECVIAYGSYFHSDQCSFAENILKCLREDQLLVMKEHPQQPGFLLRNEYRKLKKRWPNLIFLPGEIPSFDLLRKCEAVITLGGTVGYEALALSKNVINFGNVYYDAFEGVINIDSFSELYQFFREKKVYPPIGDIKTFTSKLFSKLYNGDPFPGKYLYEKSNIELVTQAIINELKRTNMLAN